MIVVPTLSEATDTRQSPYSTIVYAPGSLVKLLESFDFLWKIMALIYLLLLLSILDPPFLTMLPGLALDSWAQVILPHSWDCRLVLSYPALPQRLFSMPLYLLVLPCSLSQLSFLWALAAVYNLLV